MKKSHTTAIVDVPKGTVIKFINRLYLVTHRGLYSSTLLDILSEKTLNMSFHNVYCTIVLEGMTINKIKAHHPELLI